VADSRVVFSTDKLTDFEKVLERCEAPIASDGDDLLDGRESPDIIPLNRNRLVIERKKLM